MDDIELVQGDTDRVPFGNGTWGSRSASVGGPALAMAAERVLEKARSSRPSARMRRRGPRLRGRRVPRARHRPRIAFAEVADVAYHGARLPADRLHEPGLEETVFYEPTDTNDPQAMHLVVVFVDPETGRVRVRDYFTADDCGGSSTR